MYISISTREVGMHVGNADASMSQKNERTTFELSINRGFVRCHVLHVYTHRIVWYALYMYYTCRLSLKPGKVCGGGIHLQ